MNHDDTPAETDLEGSRDNSGWQVRLRAVLVACLLCLALILFSAWLADLNHKPRLVYPSGAAEKMATLHGASGHPINVELLKELEKEYNLPEYKPGECTVGKKYGALCQDGEVTDDGTGNACVGHGGVKGWIECR